MSLTESGEERTPPRRDRLRLVDPAAGEAEMRKSEAAPQAPPAAADRRPGKGRSALKRGALLLIGAGAIGAGLWFGLDWWRNGRFIVSTDDAYVGAELATVSAKLSANVTEIAIRQNDWVEAGQPLVVLDDGDQRIALESARAKSATAEAAVTRVTSQIEAGRASLQQARAQSDSAQADLVRTSADYERASNLAAKSYGSQATLDAATAARDRARAAVASAAAGVAAAEANIDVLEAQRVEAARQADEAKVAVEKAQRDLGFTRISAPIDGLVANTNVQLGDLVGAGKRLMSVVPLDAVYVDANFKETQVAALKVGARARISVDALPDEAFEGTVSGIAGGTGSVFTLLPPDNATGNFTKIVQRVPVRIAVSQEAARRHVLRPGMSVVVSIDPRPAAQR